MRDGCFPFVIRHSDFVISNRTQYYVAPCSYLAPLPPRPLPCAAADGVADGQGVGVGQGGTCGPAAGGTGREGQPCSVADGRVSESAACSRGRATGVSL